MISHRRNATDAAPTVKTIPTIGTAPLRKVAVRQLDGGAELSDGFDAGRDAGQHGGDVGGAEVAGACTYTHDRTRNVEGVCATPRMGKHRNCHVALHRLSAPLREVHLTILTTKNNLSMN